MVPDGGSSAGWIANIGEATDVRFKRDGTVIANMRLGTNAQNKAVPCSSFFVIDSPVSAGSHTYSMTVDGTSGSNETQVRRCKLLVMEL